MDVWRPLLDGQLASRAREAALDIAEALRGRQPESLSDATDAAVFWAYAAESFEETWVEEAYDLALENLAATIARGVPTLGLYGGLTGAAWAAQHVAGPPEEDEGDDALPPRVDAILADTLQASEWNGPYDLIGGLVGFGVYFLARHQLPNARRGLVVTMRRIDELARPADGGLGWKTPPEVLPLHHRRRHPDGLFDLGLAHGVAGVITLKSMVLLAGALPEQEEELRRSLHGAVVFLEAHRHDDREQSAFDWCLTPGITGAEARTAWCYGDLGVSIALLRASEALDDDGLRERAVRLARACATRRHEACRVQDAGLCHGAAGLGHFLNRLYQSTGDRVVGDGARRWLRDTLDRRTSDGLAGFPAYNPGTGWTPDPGILTGAAGVGLALMSALGGSPRWDQFMLADRSLSSSRAP